MAALSDLTYDELCLYYVLTDETGIDHAEFLWVDEMEGDGCYRLRDHQWLWFTCPDKRQADQCGRNLGKTESIKQRSFAFPFCFPGRDMLLTAPELNHLRPITDEVEQRLLSNWLTRGLLQSNRQGNGITRVPAWQARFVHGGQIISRLPKVDGTGVKAMHVTKIEVDECQDFPERGWDNLIECLNDSEPEAQWRIHGVSNGVRDRFYLFTTDPNSGWTVHRKMGMHRPTWSDAERQSKIKQYGGSEEMPDYRRNIYGDHGEAASLVFVLHRLMAVTDTEEASEYNTDVYTKIRISAEMVGKLAQSPVDFLSTLPGTHKVRYRAFRAGMDVGFVADPSEILVTGYPVDAKNDRYMELIARINMQRISGPDQAAVVVEVFRFYGSKLLSFGMDKSGNGLPLMQWLQKEGRRDIAERISGYGFSEKRIVALEDRDVGEGEEVEDLGVRQNVVDFATQALREYVDGKLIKLPFDRELLGEWQGQTKSRGAGFRSSGYTYSRGAHSLDAAKMLILPVALAGVDQALSAPVKAEDVLDAFVYG